MADRTAPDERLGDGAHFDRGHHARDDVLLFEGVLQRERVDDRCEHAHVIGGRAVHAARARGDAAEDVAAADHDRGLDAHALDLGDVARDLRRNRGIDPVVLFAHQGFAGEFEEDAFVWERRRVGHEMRL